MIVQEDFVFVDDWGTNFELKKGDEIELASNDPYYFDVFRGSSVISPRIYVFRHSPNRQRLFKMCEPETQLPPPPNVPTNTDPYFVLKRDQGKAQWSLVIGSLYRGLLEIVKVRMFGFEKYKSRDGWRDVADCRQRYEDAMLRHAASYASGERIDPESGLPTLAHLGCCVLFLLTLQAEASDGAK